LPEVTDLQINTGVRRELSGRRVDLSKLKVTVSGGVVTLAGEWAFVGLTKTQEESSVEMKFLESCLRNLRGVKDLVFQFDNWVKNDTGKWEPKTGSGSAGSAASGAGGEGMNCPSCKTVIKFCPCCGEPLVPGLGEAHSRVAVAGRPVLKGLPPRKQETTRTLLKPLPPVKLGEPRMKPEGGPPDAPAERTGSGAFTPIRPSTPTPESKIKPLPVPPKPAVVEAESIGPTRPYPPLEPQS